MRIIVAPDSFKESMDAGEAANAIVKGVARVDADIECIVLPVADGGEGLVSVLEDALDASIEIMNVTGPMGQMVRARFGWAEQTKTGIIEVAEACGVHLVSEKYRDVWRASTEGVGEMLVHLRERGAKTIIVGLGGSVTNDGGAGMARALGASILDASGSEVSPGPLGLHEASCFSFQTADDWKDLEILVACDVTNPLLGLDGASYVFGMQKGAIKTDLKLLDCLLNKWASLVDETIGAPDMGVIAGGGAAGGLGAALYSLLGAHLRPGIEIVLDSLKFADIIGGADLVLTGEGRVDRQTCGGKAPWGVCQKALAFGVPTIAFGGIIGDAAKGLTGPEGFFDIVGITPADSSIEDALMNGPKNLSNAVERRVRALVGIDSWRVRC